MKQNRITIALISLALIMLELAWTRIFSAEFYYPFAFLILSLAILGLGLGSLSLRYFKKLNKIEKLPVFLSLTGLSAIIGPPLVFLLGLDFTHILSFGMVIKLFLTMVILSSAYIFGGISIANIFKTSYKDMPQLYMYDLIGAGIGVIIAIILMNTLGTQITVFYCAVPVLYTAYRLSKGKQRTLPVIVTILMFILSFFASSMLEAPREEKARVLDTHWDAMAKIRILEFNQFYRGIMIDNTASSTVIGFDGKYNRPDSMKYDFGIYFGNLIKQFPKCRFVSLGAGGGKDVIQALLEGADKIYAIEVNPYINDIMTNGSLARFAGNIYRNPKVEVVTEDARAYIRKYNNKFDIIASFSSNSYAALASGAFALAENYIYTTEAIKDYWKALSDNGFIIIEHHFYIPRLVGSAIDVLKNEGVVDYTKHLAVYNIPDFHRDIILISKKPMTNEHLLNAFGTLNSPKYHNISLTYPSLPNTKNNIIKEITLNGWQSAQEKSNIDISPSNDKRPFINQMGLWKNFSFSKLTNIEPYEFYGYPLAKALIIIIILVVIILVLPFNIIPFFKKKEKLKLSAWLYFFLIGFGFMLIETVLIQKYTLFIGPSVYSIITILFSLLLFSGIGSRFSGKIPNYIPFIIIILWLIADVSVFWNLIYSLSNFDLLPRILITCLLIAPLGFFLGMPFPKGTELVGKLIDLGFAVNGAASVLGASIGIFISISAGFDAAILTGAGTYLIALGLIAGKKF
jgi:predicted membrane-bound spermidine synthase